MSSTLGMKLCDAAQSSNCMINMRYGLISRNRTASSHASDQRRSFRGNSHLCRVTKVDEVATTKTITVPRKRPVIIPDPGSEEERAKRRQLEDELRDPKNFLEYFLPRQLRVLFFGGSAVGCFFASLLSGSRLVQDPALAAVTGGAQDLAINILGLAMFSGLLYWDMSSAEKRVARRKRVRDAQIAFGDREVFVNEEGEKMSKLKEVNDEWILRRLERWGKKDRMPFIGPAKGAIVQQLVREQQPKLAVEVGTMAGYSAILIAQAIGNDSKLISVEKDWSWVLVAKRFLWQSSQGEANRGGKTVGQKVDVQWGDARQMLSKLSSTERIDFLLLDATPKETLEYLQAAEPYLAEGALVVADNAGIFAEGGMKPYLEYVRGDPKYESRYVESTLEWRPDVKDGMEVSRYTAGKSSASA